MTNAEPRFADEAVREPQSTTLQPTTSTLFQPTRSSRISLVRPSTRLVGGEVVRGRIVIDLRHGNILEGALDDVTPDVVITDPPYSAHVHASATSCGTPGARPAKDGTLKGAAHRDLGFEHLSPELREAICKLAARTRRWSVIFTDTESVGDWKTGLELAGATYIRSVPWVRWSMPQLSGDRPPQGHEMVVVAWGSSKGKKSWNGPGNLTHFAHTCMRGAGKHKAQKPLDLMLDLVEFFSNGRGFPFDGDPGDPAELICDPCFGSGTTALACAALGRNFVGTEMQADWVRKAQERIFGGASRGGVALYDDEDRWAKYEKAAAARVEDMKRMAANTARIVANRKALEERRATPPLERTPDGNINNCALANYDAQENCQMCLDACPDAERFGRSQAHEVQGRQALQGAVGRK